MLSFRLYLYLRSRLFPWRLPQTCTQNSHLPHAS
jgi:hypothetical protein